MTKHRVSEETYRKWQFDTGFTEEVDRRIAAAYRESAALIARVAHVAAGRLIELMKSPKDEIARRACLDIIGLGRKPTDVPARREAPPEQEAPTMSPETASKLLAVLADAAEGTPDRPPERVYAPAPEP